jgi:uncharacterized protein (DUF488 family)
MKPRFPVFTIGHSAHSPERFRELLERFGVDVVLDVRSSPYSGRFPHFNRDSLKTWLNESGIRYSVGGAALGGRPKSESMYANGRADYLKMAGTETFRHGLRRIAAAARLHKVALLCAEADPLDCHRFLLVGRALHEVGIDVFHILNSGVAERHRITEERLLRATGLFQQGMFEDSTDVLARAYAVQASRVAYTIPRPELRETEWKWE